MPTGLLLLKSRAETNTYQNDLNYNLPVIRLFKLEFTLYGFVTIGTDILKGDDFTLNAKEIKWNGILWLTHTYAHSEIDEHAHTRTHSQSLTENMFLRVSIDRDAAASRMKCKDEEKLWHAMHEHSFYTMCLYWRTRARAYFVQSQVQGCNQRLHAANVYQCH